MQKKNKIELIRKLRLKKGCKYLLFIPYEALDSGVLEELSNSLYELGFKDSLLVYTRTTKGIKVIEK